jgi:hypothetical protein
MTPRSAGSSEKPTADQTRKLDRMEEQNRQLRAVTMEVLALAGELRKGSIDRIMGMSDIELGLQALRGTTLRAIRYRALLHGWAFWPK